MPENFLDTSALQHHYVSGSHSFRIRQLLGKTASVCVIADTTMLEMPSALARICRGNGWGLKAFDQLHSRFTRDVAEETIVVRPSGVREIRRAIHLLRFAGVVKKKGLASADALIAACALEYAMERQQVINFYLGGHFRTGNLWTVKTGNFRCLAKTGKFYFVMSSVRKSVWIFVRQLRGPHLRTWA